MAGEMYPRQRQGSLPRNRGGRGESLLGGVDRSESIGVRENGRHTWKDMMGKDQGHLGSPLGDTLPPSFFPLRAQLGCPSKDLLTFSYFTRNIP